MRYNMGSGGLNTMLLQLALIPFALAGLAIVLIAGGYAAYILWAIFHPLLSPLLKWLFVTALIAIPFGMIVYLSTGDDNLVGYTTIFSLFLSAVVLLDKKETTQED